MLNFDGIKKRFSNENPMLSNRNKTVLFLFFLIISTFLIENYFRLYFFPIGTLITSLVLIIFFVFSEHNRIIHLLKHHQEEVINRTDLLSLKINSSIYHSTSQIQSLLSILQVVHLNKPLPNLNNWAAYPDLINFIYQRIFSDAPEVIIECGSGFSTLMIGYALKEKQCGKIYSLEHDEKYFSNSKALIEEHRLTKYVELIYAPLKEISICQKNWFWYDKQILDKIMPEKVDILLVDGPPGRIQKNSRYPAMPILYNKLTNNSIVVVDDYYRKDDNNTVKLWMSEFPSLVIEVYDTLKGTVVLSKID